MRNPGASLSRTERHALRTVESSINDSRYAQRSSTTSCPRRRGKKSFLPAICSTSTCPLLPGRSRVTREEGCRLCRYSDSGVYSTTRRRHETDALEGLAGSRPKLDIPDRQPRTTRSGTCSRRRVVLEGSACGRRPNRHGAHAPHEIQVGRGRVVLRGNLPPLQGSESGYCRVTPTMRSYFGSGQEKDRAHHGHYLDASQTRGNDLSDHLRKVSTRRKIATTVRDIFIETAQIPDLSERRVLHPRHGGVCREICVVRTDGAISSRRPGHESEDGYSSSSSVLSR